MIDSSRDSGLAVDSRLEVTNCFPHASAIGTDDDDGEQQGTSHALAH